MSEPKEMTKWLRENLPFGVITGIGRHEDTAIYVEIIHLILKMEEWLEWATIAIKNGDVNSLRGLTEDIRDFGKEER